jgi:hypothetical protein
MSECDLRVTEFQLGLIAGPIYKEKQQIYDDQLVNAKTDVEKQV